MKMAKTEVRIPMLESTINGISMKAGSSRECVKIVTDLPERSRFVGLVLPDDVADRVYVAEVCCSGPPGSRAKRGPAWRDERPRDGREFVGPDGRRFDGAPENSRDVAVTFQAKSLECFMLRATIVLEVELPA